MQVKNFQTERIFSPEKMQKLNLFDTKHFFADVYCLEPGQEQKVHTHTEADKIYAVLEGTVRVHIGDEDCDLVQNQMVLAPATVEHGVKNVSSERAALLVFMAPNPNQR